jgi:hypothetical protein
MAAGFAPTTAAAIRAPARLPSLMDSKLIKMTPANSAVGNWRNNGPEMLPLTSASPQYGVLLPERNVWNDRSAPAPVALLHERVVQVIVRLDADVEYLPSSSPEFAKQERAAARTRPLYQLHIRKTQGETLPPASCWRSRVGLAPGSPRTVISKCRISERT